MKLFNYETKYCLGTLLVLLLTLVSCGKEDDPVLLPGDAGEIELWENEQGAILLRTAPIENATGYTWYLNGEILTSTREPAFEFTESGEYTVAGTNIYGTGKPSLPITVDASGRPDKLTVEICTSKEGVVTLEAKADRAWGYRWYYGDQLMQRGPSSSYLPLDDGTYRVQAYNASGSGEFLDIEVKVGTINLLDPKVTPDSRFRDYISSISGETEFFSNKEAEKITDLNLQGQGITDVTGIRFFSNLISLNLNFSNVKYLDLRQLSKLEVIDLYSTEALLELNIEGLKNIKHLNINTSKIGQVDISGLTESLEYFNAGYSRYEAMDFTAFSKLKYINLASATKLSEIKVAGLKHLETLYVSGTAIESLDLTGCNSLKSLVASFSTQLTSLTMPAKAPVEELKIARCGKGIFDKVDIASYSKTLESFYADKLDIQNEMVFDGFEKLKEVQLDANGFASITFRNCPLLTTLRTAENTKLRTVKLENLPELQTIYCYQTGVRSLDFSQCPKLVQAIIFENRYMSKVDFTGCKNLAWLSMEISKVGPDLDISDSKNLESVTCTNTNITRIKINKIYNVNKVPFSSNIPKGAKYVHEF